MARVFIVGQPTRKGINIDRIFKSKEECCEYMKFLEQSEYYGIYEYEVEKFNPSKSALYTSVEVDHYHYRILVQLPQGKVTDDEFKKKCEKFEKEGSHIEGTVYFVIVPRKNETKVELKERTITMARKMFEKLMYVGSRW